MKLKFELGGYYLLNSERVQLLLLKQPSIEQLINYLHILMIHNGVLVLDNNQEHNYAPYKLTLYSDECNYLVMLETISIEGDINIRTFCDGSESEGFISILGEPYPETSIVKNFTLVINVFKGFLESGDVSRELLN
ncbi:DUF6911 family protein [Serratia proteamaculans]|uniref:DUF6911 family protein n=1 Tax=Serratia proteamaculans TaxID=28151 RepID=UPI0021BB0231|nr:hypothetical protein [Serratia proteamaculans]